MAVFYLFIINFITFIFFGLDKYYAQKNKWRIRENTLIFLCIIGGSIGGLAGMVFFHHKTGHKKFTVGIPAITAVQALICFMKYITIFYEL